MKKKLMLIVFSLFFIACSIAYADTAAYITPSYNGTINRYTDILEDMGFTVEVINNNNLPTTNFSKYSFSLIENDFFTNWQYLPINQFPCLILNIYYMDKFHWAKSMGGTFSSGYLSVYVNDPNNFITKGYPLFVSVYNKSGLSYNYVSKYSRAPGLKIVASTYYDPSNGVISTADEGALLKDNVYSNAKGVFFGIDKTDYWTSYSEEMFRNSVIWLTTDLVAPKITNVSVKDRTNESARITWVTDKFSNSTVFYGKSTSLGSVKADNSRVRNHNMLLDGLEELTTYYYKVESCNKDGYCNSSSILNFATLDLTPPHIASREIANITNSSVNISITTTENANLTVFYGSNKSSLNNKIVKSSFGASFKVYIGGLNEKSTYFYSAYTCDAYGNCENSPAFNFTTLDLTLPYLIAKEEINITNSSLKISITTSEEANITIFYGTNKNSPDKKAVKPSFDILSMIYIGGLNEKSTYFYSALICDAYGNCGNSPIFNFTTLDWTPPNMPRNLVLNVINSNNRIRVKWDAPDGEAVFRYNIYISGSADNFNFGNPNVSTAITEYIDNSASLAKQRYYAVRAEDNAGNEEKNVNIVGKFDLELGIGHNLVSLPLDPFSRGINDVMHQDASYHPVSEIKRFNNSKNGFETTNYNGLFWNTSLFHELSNGGGYFFKSNQRVNFTTVGRLSGTTYLEIREGMNLFGLASLGNKNIADFVNAADATEIGKRNEDGSYYLATYYAGGWNNAFALKPGIGYWMKAGKNFSMMVGP